MVLIGVDHRPPLMLMGQHTIYATIVSFKATAADEQIEQPTMPYTPKPDHRNGSPQKSQWCISVTDEEQCYATAASKNWGNSVNYWGLHFPQDAPQKLGTSPASDPLFIAKFVSNQGNWHGYPIAHWLSPFDKPDEHILDMWSTEGLISSTKKSKIHRGKKCVL